jgi:hypothetical protein
VAITAWLDRWAVKGMSTVRQRWRYGAGIVRPKITRPGGAGGGIFIGARSVVGAKGEKMRGLSWDQDLTVVVTPMTIKISIATKII